MSFSADDLLAATSGVWATGDRTLSFSRLSIDTRSIKPGDLFIALKGPRFDGHDYLQQAVSSGAAGIMIHRELSSSEKKALESMAVLKVAETLTALQDLGRFSRQRSQAKVVGITGSNGKTSTKEMLAAILGQAGPTLSTRGNLNNQIGLPLMLCELRPEHAYAVIEMGTSHPGDMDLLADLTRADIALITNVGKDHLAFFGTPEGVLKENRILIDRLPSTGTAVLNLDDDWLRPLAHTLPCAQVTYSTRTSCDVHARTFVTKGSSLEFTLDYGDETLPLFLNVPDVLQGRNAVAAAAVAYALHVPSAAVIEGLIRFKPASMRLQSHHHSSGALLINDAYNANPTSVRASIESVQESYPNRARWLVLGDMRELGEIARSEHHDLGVWLNTQSLERIYLYGRDTRFVEQALRSSGTIPVERFRKKRYLIEALQKALGSGHPVVLFKASRGLKLEQVIDALKGQVSVNSH